MRWWLPILLVACDAASDDDGADTDTDAVETDVVDVDPWADHVILTTQIMNVAHRGGAHIAPEHTMVAYQAAVDAGADMLELDIWSTSDDVLVLLHDASVDRTTDGTGFVQEMTLVEAQALDAGFQFSDDGGTTFPHRDMGLVIPALDDVFTAFPDMLYSLEIKQNSPPIVQPLLDLIDAHDLRGQVVVGGFDDSTIQSFRALAPDVLTTLGVAEATGFYFLTEDEEAIYEVPARYFAAPLEFAGLTMDQDVIDKAHRLDIALHMWTINDPAEMDLVLDWGVDGVITDDPITLEAKLQDRGLAP